MKRQIVLLAFLISSQLTFSQNNTSLIKQDVSILADDFLQGRNTGSNGEKIAAGYIVGRFVQLGMQPKGTESYFQPFSAYERKKGHHANVDSSNKINGMNVIGLLDYGATNTVVIGAHYDHLGLGGQGSLYTGTEPQIHNGADDNASGIAGILSIATEITNNPNLYNKNNYLFIAFSGEEKGLWGSNWFCKHPTIDLSKVNYMINLDMVGRLNAEKKLMVYGTGTSPIWDKTVTDLAKNKFHIIKKPSGIGPSDHTSFYLQNLPVLHFFTGQHKDYHKPTDDLDKVNFAGIKEVSNYITSIIKTTNSPDKIVFTKTKDENSKKMQTFKVTLGVMPDYMYDGKGMRIDGVKEGKTAHNAGMKAGDIVMQMGENTVENMTDYMKCLGKFEKGESTDVKINRNGEIQSLKVTFI